MAPLRRMQHAHRCSQLQTCGRALQVPPPEPAILTGTVGIGKLVNDQWQSWLRLSSGRPPRVRLDQLQRYAVRTLGHLGGHPFWLTRRRRAQFGDGSAVARVAASRRSGPSGAPARRTGSRWPVRPAPTGDHGVFDPTPDRRPGHAARCGQGGWPQITCDPPPARGRQRPRGIPPKWRSRGPRWTPPVGVPGRPWTESPGRGPQ